MCYLDQNSQYPSNSHCSVFISLQVRSLVVILVSLLVSWSGILLISHQQLHSVCLLPLALSIKPRSRHSCLCDPLTTAILIHSLVSLCLDYCMSLVLVSPKTANRSLNWSRTQLPASSLEPLPPATSPLSSNTFSF